MHRLITMLSIASIMAFGAHAGDVAPSAEAAEPLAKGAAIPDVSLKTASGEEVKLRELVAEKPAAIIFYRGGWCPYCNVHLKNVQKIEDDIVAKGYQILAISPDNPEHLQQTAEKQKVSYQLLSDSDMSAAKAFGVAFRLDSETLKKYNEFGINLEESSSGGNKDSLPVPAFYLVNREGEITFAHTDPDYTKRISAEDIKAAL